MSKLRKIIAGILLVATILSSVVIVFASSSNLYSIEYQKIDPQAPINKYLFINNGNSIPIDRPEVIFNSAKIPQWLERKGYQQLEDDFKKIFGLVKAYTTVKFIENDKEMPIIDYSTDPVYRIFQYDLKFDPKLDPHTIAFFQNMYKELKGKPISVYIPTRGFRIEDNMKYFYTRAEKVFANNYTYLWNYKFHGGIDNPADRLDHGDKSLVYYIMWDATKRRGRGPGVYDINAGRLVGSDVDNRFVFRILRPELAKAAANFFSDVSEKDYYAPYVTMLTVAQAIDGYWCIRKDKKTGKVIDKRRVIRWDRQLTFEDLWKIMSQFSRCGVGMITGGVYEGQLSNYKEAIIHEDPQLEQWAKEMQKKYKLKSLDEVYDRYLYNPGRREALKYYKYDYSKIGRPITRFELALAFMSWVKDDYMAAILSVKNPKQYPPKRTTNGHYIGASNPYTMAIYLNQGKPATRYFRKVKIDNAAIEKRLIKGTDSDKAVYGNPKYYKYAADYLELSYKTEGVKRYVVFKLYEPFLIPINYSVIEQGKKLGVFHSNYARWLDNKLQALDLFKNWPNMPKEPDANWWYSPATLREAIVLYDAITAYLYNDHMMNHEAVYHDWLDYDFKNFGEFLNYLGKGY